MDLSRRGFLRGAAASLSSLFSLPLRAADEAEPPSLSGEVGITTSSLSGHVVPESKPGKFTLLELPRILRDELDMRTIDLNTSTLASQEPAYLDRVRQAAADAGCILTNLKLNQRGLDMGSGDRAVRDKALAQYKRSIDAAAQLGCRWARPLPLRQRPQMDVYIAAYRELADYAAERNVRMLVENYGWMESDPASVVTLIRAVDRNLAASPDTGNWSSDEVRFAGLRQTYPLAVTCDFKFRALGPNGEHALYDLEKGFRVGWDAGFRGPWCLEHANRDRAALFRELALVRDLLRGWMRVDDSCAASRHPPDAPSSRVGAKRPSSLVFRFSQSHRNAEIH